jgi:hypothetical protein
VVRATSAIAVIGHANMIAAIDRENAIAATDRGNAIVANGTITTGVAAGPVDIAIAAARSAGESRELCGGGHPHVTTAIDERNGMANFSVYLASKDGIESISIFN